MQPKCEKCRRIKDLENEQIKEFAEHDVFVATAQAEMEKRDDIIATMINPKDCLKTSCPSLDILTPWEKIAMGIRELLGII